MLSSRLLTPTLAVLALIVVVLVVARVLALSAAATPLDASAPGTALHAHTAPGAGAASAVTSAGPGAGARDGPIPAPTLVDATAGSGLLGFRHDRGTTGLCWIPELMGAGGALLDHDGDGDLDVYLVQGGSLTTATDVQRNRLYRNDGALRFRDVSDGSGADVPGHGMGAAAADVDDDGDVDLYLTRLGPDVLLLNEGGGRFADGTLAAGLGDPGYGSSAAFFDLDVDGALDLYVVNYVDWSPDLERPCYGPAGVRDYCNPRSYPPQADRLYKNLGAARFEDVSQSSGVAAVVRDGLAVLATDLDDDGFVDLYVANDQMPACLWRNQGDGTLRESALLAGCAFDEHGLAIAGMGIACEDLDDDGDFDLLVSNIIGQSHLGLRNDGGRFSDRSRAWGLAGWSFPSTGFGLVLFDQDHDGALDLFVANGQVNLAHEPERPDDPFAQANQLARRGGAGRFDVVSAAAEPAVAAVATSRAVLCGDLDDDGDLDLIVTNNGSSPQLLRNDADPSRAWTLVEVRARAGGPHANSARVEVTAGGRTWRREVRPQAGYLGSNDPRVHVGLGAATRIERLVVRWPDGRRDEATDLPVRQRLLVVREPAFAVQVLDG